MAARAEAVWMCNAQCSSVAVLAHILDENLDDFGYVFCKSAMRKRANGSLVSFTSLSRRVVVVEVLL